ncbi:hypothetical protein HYT84_00315 [Candidatus Micrarchaeota archaeon]|nr:hypothetical protein [Candidatus Micrarchaeota archaeon]
MDKNEMLALFIKLGRKAKKLIKEVDNGKEKLEKNYFGDTSIKMDLVLEEMVKEEINDLNFQLITEEKPEKSNMECSGTVILDPLDGSKNYERGFPAYAFAIAGSTKNNPTLKDIDAAVIVNLYNSTEYRAIKNCGAYKNGEKIKLDEEISNPPLVSADFGRDEVSSSKIFPNLSKFAYMRMLGAATLEMAATASGIVDAYVDVRGKLLITHTAGIMLMKEAGIIISDKHGNEITQTLDQDTRFTIIACREKKLHKKLVGICDQ